MPTPLSVFKDYRDLLVPALNTFTDDALKDLGLIISKGRVYSHHLARALRATDMKVS